MDFHDVLRLIDRLSEASRSLDYLVRNRYDDSRIYAAKVEYRHAVGGVKPLVDLLEDGEAIAGYHVVVVKRKGGAFDVIKTATQHDLADRFNAAEVAAPPQVDPGIEYVPAQYAGEPEYVDKFHE